MNKWQGALLLGFVIILVQGCSFLYQDTKPPESDAITDVTQAEDTWEVTDISGVNQNDDPWSVDDLSGQWWITNTIFTRCPTVCMTMTPNMVVLQDEIRDENIDLEIVSFTVDPEFDTPERLADYGESYGASFENWNFITGYSAEELEEFVFDSLKAYVIPTDNDIMHPTNFYLINPEGEVVRFYKGESDFDLEATLEDLKFLIEE